MIPSCPDGHGSSSMQSQEAIGAPTWYVCNATVMGKPGNVCGRSAHEEEDAC